MPLNLQHKKKSVSTNAQKGRNLSRLPSDVVQDGRLRLYEGVVDLVSMFIDDSDPGAGGAIRGQTHFTIERKNSRLVLGPRAPLG